MQFQAESNKSNPPPAPELLHTHNRNTMIPPVRKTAKFCVDKTLYCQVVGVITESSRQW